MLEILKTIFIVVLTGVTTSAFACGDEVDWGTPPPVIEDITILDANTELIRCFGDQEKIWNETWVWAPSDASPQLEFVVKVLNEHQLTPTDFKGLVYVSSPQADTPEEGMIQLLYLIKTFGFGYIFISEDGAAITTGFLNWSPECSTADPTVVSIGEWSSLTTGVGCSVAYMFLN